MGRWMKKIGNMTKNELTELTHHSSVGFVSTVSEHFQKNKTQKLKLIKLIEKCCINLNVDPQQVIDNLLSIDDEQDIINREIPIESLYLAIKLWTSKGSPQISGKNNVKRNNK